MSPRSRRSADATRVSCAKAHAESQHRGLPSLRRLARDPEVELPQTLRGAWLGKRLGKSRHPRERPGREIEFRSDAGGLRTIWLVAGV